MKGIYEYTCTHQIACLICCTGTTFMLYFHHNNRDKRRHNDGRRTSSVSQRPRMEISHKEEKRREGIFLRQEVEERRYLPWSRCQGGGNHQRRGLGETSQGTIKKPPERWQTKQFTAVRLFLTVSRPRRNSHSYNLPTFSITKVAQQCNGYATMWAYERRCAHE